jgi:NADH dehydrogenase
MGRLASTSPRESFCMTLAHPLTVAVTGATGFVGRHVVEALLARGHTVRALVRDTAKASQVFRPIHDRSRLTQITAEGLTASAARELVEGAQALVNCIGIIREQDGQRFEALHVEAVRTLVDACEASGSARRLVQISALGVHPDGRAEYQRTKFRGETIVRGSALDWTILRPSGIVGDGGELTELMARWARGGTGPFMPYFSRLKGGEWSLIPGETEDPSVAPVAVRDVARAAADALEHPQTIGEVYNLCGAETVRWPELLTFVRDHTPRAKRGIKPAGIPAPAAHLAATVAGIVGLGGLLPFDAGMAAMAAEDSTADMDKFRAHFGFAPGSFREPLRAAVAGL